MNNKDSNYNKREAILKAIKSTFNYSSIHSFPNLVENKSYIIKLIWIISFILSLITCTYTIYGSILSYLDYEVISTIDVKNSGFIDFPMIKICDINPLSKHLHKKVIMDSFERYGNDDRMKIFEHLEFDNSKDPYLIQSSYLRNINFFHYFSMGTSLLKKQPEKMDLDYKINETLISCLFGSKICDKTTDFEYYYDPYFGNCFKFNSGQNMNGLRVRRRYTSQTGRLNGLNIELSLSNNDKPFSFLKGFSIFITPQGVDEPFTEGVYAPPGYSTNIILEKEITHKHSKRNRPCILDLASIDSSDSILFKRIVQVQKNYDKRNCLKMCLQKSLEDNCNCTDQNYFSFYNNMHTCTSYDDTICSFRNYEDFLYKKLFINCDCPDECDQTNYSYRTSLAKYPSENYANFLINNPVIISKLKNQTKISYQDLRENLVSVNIFFNEIKETVISEYPKMITADLIANIGGIIGLFLGKA